MILNWKLWLKCEEVLTLSIAVIIVYGVSLHFYFKVNKSMKGDMLYKQPYWQSVVTFILYSQKFQYIDKHVFALGTPVPIKM